MAGAALVLSLATSQAQVYSANVVGYVNRVIPAYPGYAVVANPLDTGNNVLTNLLQKLPVGSQVLKWDYNNSTFDKVFSRNSIGAGWSPTGSGTNTLNLGEACVVQLGSTYVGTFTNTFVGTVLQGSISNVIMFPGYTFASFPVPVTGTATDAVINLNASLPSSPSGSEFLAFNEVAQNGFTLISTRNGIGAGWSGGIPQITLGTGFFIINNGSTNRPWNINFTAQ